MSDKVRFPTWPSDNPEGDWILMDPDERDEWFDWFTRHGIDPNYVTAPGTAIADDRVRRICYVAYETDERGQVRVRDGKMVRVGRVVQLEARALPFPQPSPEIAPHFADPSCRCDGPRCGSRFSGLAERADRRTT